MRARVTNAREITAGLLFYEALWYCYYRVDTRADIDAITRMRIMFFVYEEFIAYENKKISYICLNIVIFTMDGIKNHGLSIDRVLPERN